MASLNSATSLPRMLMSLSFVTYFSNLSHACICANIISFLSRQRVWQESANELMKFHFFLRLRLQIFVSISNWFSISARFKDLLKLQSYSTLLSCCGYRLRTKPRNQRYKLKLAQIQSKNLQKINKVRY